MKDKSIGIIEIVKFARERSFGISSIKSSETSLNDVLLHYTGKRVEERDYGWKTS